MFPSIESITAGFLFVLVVSWLIVSLAVFFAARVVAGSKATFGRALGLVLVGVVIIGLFSVVVSAVGSFAGPAGLIVGSIIAFILWLGLIKSFFHTGWLAALGIALLAYFMLIVVVLLIVFAAGLMGITISHIFQSYGFQLPL